jgi:hypothetical protein
MSADKLRVGLVGAGPWARKVHAPGVAGHTRTRLAAVWGRRAEAAAEVATAYGAVPTTDFDELLGQVDAVAFAVPPAVQAPLAARAAQAGKHLMLEKPVAPTVQDAEVLADAVAKAGVVSTVVLTFRYAAATRAWLDAVREVDDWVGGEARWFSGTLLDAALGTVKTVELARFTSPGLWHVMLGHDGGRLSTATLSMHTPIQPAVTDFAVHGPRGLLALNASGEAPERYATLLDDFTALVEHDTTEHPLDVRRGLHVQRVLGQVSDQLAGG